MKGEVREDWWRRSRGEEEGRLYVPLQREGEGDDEDVEDVALASEEELSEGGNQAHYLHLEGHQDELFSITRARTRD